MRERIATRLIFLMLALITLGRPAWADPQPPTDPVANFSKAKQIARNVIYDDHRIDIYCGCSFKRTGAASSSGGSIVRSSCTYKPRKSATRGKRLEWEHIMPASYFGSSLACWRHGDDACERNGRPYKGRSCCVKVDDFFAAAEADLHNLAPSVGELNGDRSDKPYGDVGGEPRLYGACDFEVDQDADITEPPDEVRGDVARTWFYMSETYDAPLDPDMITLLNAWARSDPPDDWEMERDRRIEEQQGNSNRYVTNPACNGSRRSVSFPCDD